MNHCQVYLARGLGIRPLLAQDPRQSHTIMLCLLQVADQLANTDKLMLEISNSGEETKHKCKLEGAININLNIVYREIS